LKNAAKHSVATQTLLFHIESGKTATLSIGAGAAELTMHLFEGGLVAATALNDARLLIRRLLTEGLLTTDAEIRVKSLERTVGALGSHGPIDAVLGVLIDIVPPRDLSRLLLSRFEDNVARFAGSVSRPRVKEVEVVWASNLQTAHDSVELVSRCARLWDMGAAVDLEWTLLKGVLTPKTPAQQHACSLLSRSRGVKAHAVIAKLPAEFAEARAFLVDMLRVGMAKIEGGVDEHALQGLLEVESLDSPVPDEATEPSMESASPNPTAGWGGSVTDEELEAFAGLEDEHRGGSGGGQFTGEQLDLVDFEEVDEPRRGNFAAPSLSEDEMVSKVEVANEVLEVIARAFNGAHGAGHGSTAIQLLVDGSPRQYTSLFEATRVSQLGTLPTPSILRNVQMRPEPEQRRLLNQGMLDLLDRALSRAADDLPDEAIDSVLERVVGYRQRLGL